MPDAHPLPRLEVTDFPHFFSALWSVQAREPVTPFPWQVDLVAQVHRERRWPDLVDLPTGAGKTSLFEMAVFLQALDAENPPQDRWMPRRVVLVVDRRVVVDQADQRGNEIRRAIETAPDGVLHAVAERLRSLSAGSAHERGDMAGPALVTAVLRGGIVRDESWARRPDVPALISSTVDQVGSRLLFRGYGLSRSMRPVHAGLLANDVLFLLDEVHLARPFAETLAQVDHYRRSSDHGTDGWPDRWQVVQLSATPSGSAERRFPAEPVDPASHPVLRRRLEAVKPARLGVVKVGRDSEQASEAFAAACVRHAGEILEHEHIRTVGVVVNRVDTARRVARLLQEQGTDMCLLTGRMRPLDRERVLRAVGDRLAMGRTRRADDRPFVVVATQSIEAGADFDLDGLVTECASLDALRQRFGRVDRGGWLADRQTPSSSVVLIRSVDVTPREPDPIYGDALAATWAWLQERADDAGVVDFGITALDVPEGELAGLVAEQGRAPLLLPVHLDQWVQTSHPSTIAEPEVARWLHGPDADTSVADVQLVWREDLDASLFQEENLEAHEEMAEAVVNRVTACPPMSTEALAVPFATFVRWARGERADLATADVDTTHTPEDSTGPGPHRLSRWLRWGGPSDSRLVGLDEVQPGDTLVVPASLGGVWNGTWDPAATEPVPDLASVALAVQRGRAVVRLSRAALGLWTRPSSDDDTAGADESDGPSDTTTAVFPDPLRLDQLPVAERRAEIRDVLARVAAAVDRADPLADVLGRLVSDADLELRSFPERVRDGRVEHSYVVWSRRPITLGESSIAADDGADATSFTGVESEKLVGLPAHLRGVEAWARHLATNVGLPPELVADIALAGRFHDVGKADPRFQMWLHGADEMRCQAALADGVLLAKSTAPDTDRARRRWARARSRYPWRARHELLSLAMLDTDGWADAASDPELVRHLVASHHGHGRYRFDPVLDRHGPAVELPLGDVTLRSAAGYDLARLDRGVPDRFWNLVRRYGWFRLAWLEALLRLADHARSRQEQEGEVTSDDDDGDAGPSHRVTPPVEPPAPAATAPGDGRERSLR